METIEDVKWKIIKYPNKFPWSSNPIFHENEDFSSSILVHSLFAWIFVEKKEENLFLLIDKDMKKIRN